MDMNTNTWTLVRTGGASVQVNCDGFVIGPNGDIAFGNDLDSDNPFYVRAFAKDEWKEVRLYS